MSRRSLSETIVGLGRPVAYYPALASRIGVKGAVLLSQLLYWSSVVGLGQWFYKSSDELLAETGMTRQEQEGARLRLVNRHLIQERYNRSEHRLYFRILKGTVDQLLDVDPEAEPDPDPAPERKATTEGEVGLADGHSSKERMPFVQTSDGHSSKERMAFVQRTNGIRPKNESIIIETTQETTQRLLHPPVAGKSSKDREEDRERNAQAGVAIAYFKAKYQDATGQPYLQGRDDVPRDHANFKRLFQAIPAPPNGDAHPVNLLIDYFFESSDEGQFSLTMSHFYKTQTINRLRGKMCTTTSARDFSSRTARNRANGEEAIRRIRARAGLLPDATPDPAQGDGL